MEQPSEPHRDRTSSATARVLALVLGAVLASIDLVLGLRASAETGIGILLPPLAITFAAAVVVYAISWFAVCVPLAKTRNWSRTALAVGLCVTCLSTAVILLALKRMQFELSPALGAVALVVGCGAGALVGLAVALIERSTACAAWLRRAAVACAALAMLGSAALWWRAPRGHSTLDAGDGHTPAHRPALASPIRRVILIVIDTLRADALSCYGSKTNATPAMDALASEGVLFEHARSAAPWTLPSMTSILTGLAPAVHLAVHGDSVLPEGATTFAERMRAAGYRTAAIGRNSFLHPRARLNRGFDEYTFYPRLWSGTPMGTALLRAMRPPKVPDDPIAEYLTMEALQWMQAHHDEPTFLWLHYFDPHLPYEPPREFVPEGDPPSGMSRRFAVPVVEARSGLFIPNGEQRQWIRGLYDGESRYTDRSVGRLLEELKRLGMYDDTLIVLTADHGEELWEHDSFEHGHSLYDELLHVPLIVRPPGGGGGRRVATPVSTVGLVPTVLELCGLPWKPDDFSSPPLLGPAADKAGPRPLFAGGLLSLENRSCVVWENLKLIRRAVTGREELFDLARDPAELHSLPPESSERTPELRKLLEQHLRDSAALRARLGILDPAKMDLDDATMRDLRNLGYVK